MDQERAELRNGISYICFQVKLRFDINLILGVVE